MLSLLLQELHLGSVSGRSLLTYALLSKWGPQVLNTELTGITRSAPTCLNTMTLLNTSMTQTDAAPRRSINLSFLMKYSCCPCQEECVCLKRLESSLLVIQTRERRNRKEISCTVWTDLRSEGVTRTVHCRAGLLPSPFHSLLSSMCVLLLLALTLRESERK